jgi:hypothetical protein
LTFETGFGLERLSPLDWIHREVMPVSSSVYRVDLIRGVSKVAYAVVCFALVDVIDHEAIWSRSDELESDHVVEHFVKSTTVALHLEVPIARA